MQNVKRKIFEEIVDVHARWQKSPTRADIRFACGGLTDDVDLHLEQLAREGLINLNDGNLVLLEPTFHQVPPVEIQSSIPFDRSRAYAPTVSGPITLDLRSIGVEVGVDMWGFQILNDDMIDAGIMCGDIAIMTDQPGSDIVAVWIDNLLTLRRLIRVNSIPHYVSENPVRPTLVCALDLPHGGMLWGVLRAGIAQRPRRRISYSEDCQSMAASKGASTHGGINWNPEDDMRYTSVKPKKGSTSTRSRRKTRAKLPPFPPRVGLNECNDANG